MTTAEIEKQKTVNVGRTRWRYYEGICEEFPSDMPLALAVAGAREEYLKAKESLFADGKSPEEDDLWEIRGKFVEAVDQANRDEIADHFEKVEFPKIIAGLRDGTVQVSQLRSAIPMRSIKDPEKVVELCPGEEKLTFHMPADFTAPIFTAR